MWNSGFHFYIFIHACTNVLSLTCPFPLLLTHKETLKYCAPGRMQRGARAFVSRLLHHT